MTPLDLDTNGIADAWEHAQHGSNVNPLADFDGDGLSERDEYRLGSDPNDPDSVLSGELRAQGTNPVILVWPVMDGRVYRVQVNDQIRSSNWITVYGPATADVTQTHMEWTDLEGFSRTNRFYRIDALLP